MNIEVGCTRDCYLCVNIKNFKLYLLKHTKDYCQLAANTRWDLVPHQIDRILEKNL